MLRRVADLCNIPYSVLKSFFPLINGPRSSLQMRTHLCCHPNCILWLSVIEHSLATNMIHFGSCSASRSAQTQTASGHLMSFVRYSLVPEGWCSSSSQKPLHLTCFVVIAETNTAFQEMIHVFQKQTVESSSFCPVVLK